MDTADEHIVRSTRTLPNQVSFDYLQLTDVDIMLKTYSLCVKVYVRIGPLALFSHKHTLEQVGKSQLLLPFPLPTGTRGYYPVMLSYGNVPDAQQSEQTSSWRIMTAEQWATRYSVARAEAAGEFKCSSLLCLVLFYQM